MAIKDYQSLIEFIQTANSSCAHELIALFAAIKLKNADAGFDKEQLVNFFIEFYQIRKKNDLTSEKECDPLQFEDRREIIQLINRNPIAALLKAGILKTFERFDPNIFKIIFDNTEELLSTIKSRIGEVHSESFGESRETMELVLSEWENIIDQTLKADALQKMAGSIEKINLEFMLKYLYQSYSLLAFNKMLKSFQIDEQDFENFFTSRMEDLSKFFKGREQKEKLAEIEEEPKVLKQPTSHIQELTNFFQKMREETEEEQVKTKIKKKKKK